MLLHPSGRGGAGGNVPYEAGGKGARTLGNSKKRWHTFNLADVKERKNKISLPILRPYEKTTTILSAINMDKNELAILPAATNTFWFKPFSLTRANRDQLKRRGKIGNVVGQPASTISYDPVPLLKMGRSATYTSIKSLLFGRTPRLDHNDRCPNSSSLLAANSPSDQTRGARPDDVSQVLTSLFPFLIRPPTGQELNCRRTKTKGTSFKRAQSVPSLGGARLGSSLNWLAPSEATSPRLNQTFVVNSGDDNTSLNPFANPTPFFTVKRHLSSVASLKSTAPLMEDITRHLVTLSCHPPIENSDSVRKVFSANNASGSSGCSLDTYDTLEDGNAAELNEKAGYPRDRKDSGVGASLAGILSNSPTNNSCEAKSRELLADFDKSLIIGDANASANRNDDPSHPPNISAFQYPFVQKLAGLSLAYYFSNVPAEASKNAAWKNPTYDVASSPQPPQSKRFSQPMLNTECVLFGLSLKEIYALNGTPIPSPITGAMDYLKLHCLDTVGLFRKSGLKSRVLTLKSQMIQSTIDGIPFCDYSTFQPYDLADIIKLFFRELPEPLFPKNICLVLNQIMTELPLDLHLPAIQCALLLLPDENRDALALLLNFCQTISISHPNNQMTPSNIAVCLCPTVFYNMAQERSADVAGNDCSVDGDSCREPDWLSFNKALARSLTLMIKRANSVLTIPRGIMRVLTELSQYLKKTPIRAPTSHYQDLQLYLFAHVKQIFELSNPTEFCNVFNCGEIIMDYKLLHSTSFANLTEHHLSQPTSGFSMWKVSFKVPGYPIALLKYLQTYRPVFEVEKESEINNDYIKLPQNAQIVKVYSPFIPQQHSNPATCLQSLHVDTSRSTCISLCFSMGGIKSSQASGGASDLNLLASDFIIKPSGSGISTLIYICCVDFRGHSRDWLISVFSRYLYKQMNLVKENFQALYNIKSKETGINT